MPKKVGQRSAVTATSSRVDDAEPPLADFWIVALGASAGGLAASAATFLSGAPALKPDPVVVLSGTDSEGVRGVPDIQTAEDTPYGISATERIAHG